MRCIFGAIPEVFAGFFGRATLFAFVTPPVMFAILRFTISAVAFRAIPAFVRASVFAFTMARVFANGTDPAMRTVFRIAQHFFAGRTVAVTFRAGEIKRMPRLTGGTVPEVRAGFADFVRGSTRRVRTIPAVGSGNVADPVFPVMIMTSRTIPVVGAIFARCKDTFAGTAETISGIHTDRTGRRMYPVAARMTPQMIAKRVSVINP